ncbi:hypothetical protein BJX96DRAFT_20479 [Aspergillus floccosus]
MICLYVCIGCWGGGLFQAMSFLSFTWHRIKSCVSPRPSIIISRSSSTVILLHVYYCMYPYFSRQRESSCQTMLLDQ